MFSGIQEILVIGLIIVVILLAPRMLSRGQDSADRSSPADRTRRKLSRPMRLAVVLSVVWLAATAATFQPWTSDPSPFLLVGISPVAILWGILWIRH